MPPDTCACRHAKGFEVGGNFGCDGQKACYQLQTVAQVRRNICPTCWLEGYMQREGRMHKAALPTGTGAVVVLFLV